MIMQRLEKQAVDTEFNVNDNVVSSAVQNYADIVALSTRRTSDAIDLTLPRNTLDKDDEMAFKKEISSDGNVNTMLTNGPHDWI
jgi:hypothetical protein